LARNSGLGGRPGVGRRRRGCFARRNIHTHMCKYTSRGASLITHHKPWRSHISVRNTRRRTKARGYRSALDKHCDFRRLLTSQGRLPLSLSLSLSLPPLSPICLLYHQTRRLIRCPRGFSSPLSCFLCAQQLPSLAFPHFRPAFLSLSLRASCSQNISFLFSILPYASFLYCFFTPLWC
jgi:hypothetical protein